MNREEKINQYVKTNGKSELWAFLLVLLLGPFGYLYVSVVGGLIMLFVMVAIGKASAVSGELAVDVLFIAWAIGIIMAPIQARAKNKALRAQAELMTPDNP